MADELTDFKLARNSYASFDALTLKQLIRDRLNQGGVFTDQNFTLIIQVASQCLMRLPSMKT